MRSLRRFCCRTIGRRLRVRVALLNPYEMRDADRDAIAAAVSLGRTRIEALVAPAAPPGGLDQIATELKLDGWRRRAAQWDPRSRSETAAVAVFHD